MNVMQFSDKAKAEGVGGGHSHTSVIWVRAAVKDMVFRQFSRGVIYQDSGQCMYNLV